MSEDYNILILSKSWQYGQSNLTSTFSTFEWLIFYITIQNL